MDASYDSYRYSFESCKSYKDGSVSPNDFARICNRYKLNYKIVMEHVSTDGEGRFSLDAFIHYLKRTHHQYSNHQSHTHEPPSYPRSNSPPTSHRPLSASKLTRQSVIHQSTHHHHSRHAPSSSRNPVSPTMKEGGVGPYDNERLIDDEIQSRRRQEIMKTPDNLLSPDEKVVPRAGHDRNRDYHPYEHYVSTIRPRMGSHSRGTVETPPPAITNHHSRYRNRRESVAGRSENAHSFKGDSEDEDINQDAYYTSPPNPPRSNFTKNKHPLNETHDIGKLRRPERDRLDPSSDRTWKDNHVTDPNPDLAYAQLVCENENLRQKLKQKEMLDTEMDRVSYERQFEKMRGDLEDELLREKNSHKAYKKECHARKAEYNILKLKNEELQRSKWRLQDDNHKLQVRLMEEDRSSSFSRHPGDGGSEETSGRSSYASDLAFQKTPLRQTYGGIGKGEVTKDQSSHSRKGLKRVSSEGKTIDHDEPVRETSGYGYTRAKTHKSGTSSVASMLETHALMMVSTTPDEQSQFFMVLGEDVSTSVLPEGLSKERELAMIYALQNCHTVQELIKCLVSYGVSTSSDQLQGFQVENKHLKECVDHLNAKNTTLTHSFQSAKLNMDEMYHSAEKMEANNIRLKLALKLAQQACETSEILLELRSGDPRGGNYFPSFDNSSLDSTLARSLDREQISIKHTATYRARSLLHNLDLNVELQHYLPQVKMRQGDNYQTHVNHWPPGTLSQNTGTTSGLSSMSGGIEGDITSGEMDRLRQYIQALLHYRNDLISSLASVDGLKGLETIKKFDVIKDCAVSDHGGSITDLEDAAHAEELCKVREEKAELRSQIYMMEQEKRRMELEVSRMVLYKNTSDRQLVELNFLYKEEKRKRKKQRTRGKESALPNHEPNHMSELSLEYTSALEREKEISERYEGLFHFLQSHVKDSQSTTEDLMRFVKELRRANSALVDAFEKSKKRQQAEKKRMKQELVLYMNKRQASPGGHQTDESPPPVGGAIHT